jgi:hypothetical protein
LLGFGAWEEDALAREHCVKPWFLEALGRMMRFGGYGSLDASLCVFGAEEHGDNSVTYDDAWMRERAMSIRELDPPFVYPTPPGAWRYAFLLAARVQLPGSDENTFQQAWLKQPDLLLLSNILPMPKRKLANWHLTISRRKYRSMVRERRIPYLQQLRGNPQSVVVCYGKETRDLAKSVFVLPEEMSAQQRITDASGRYIEVFPKSRAVFSPFFLSHQMTNALFDRLCETVSALLPPSDLRPPTPPPPRFD